MKTLRLIGMAVIAVIMSVNFAACSDDDDDTIDTIDTSSLEGTWGLVRSAGWELGSTDTEKDIWDYTDDPHNPDYESEKIFIKKLSDNTYSITSYYYSGSDWIIGSSQTGTLNGKTLVLKDYYGWHGYTNPVIETLTAEKLVLHMKYDNIEPDPDHDPGYRCSGDFTETYTKMK